MITVIQKVKRKIEIWHKRIPSKDKEKTTGDIWSKSLIIRRLQMDKENLPSILSTLTPIYN